MIDFKQAFNEPFKANDSWKKIGIFYGINVGFYFVTLILAIIWFIALAAVGIDVNGMMPAPCEGGGCPMANPAQFLPMLPVFIPLGLLFGVFLSYTTGYSLDFIRNVINKEESPLPCYGGNTKHFIVRGFKAIVLMMVWMMVLFSPFALSFLIVSLNLAMAPVIKTILFASLGVVFLLFSILLSPVMSYSFTAFAYGLSMKRALDIKLIFNLFKKTWQSYLVFIGLVIAYQVAYGLLTAIGLSFALMLLSFVVGFVINAMTAHIFIEALEKSEGEIA